MKNRKEFKDYGTGILSFGMYKGLTIQQIIAEKEDYRYVIWLHDNVKRITIKDSDYNFCKRRVEERGSRLDEVLSDYLYGDYGDRD